MPIEPPDASINTEIVSFCSALEVPSDREDGFYFTAMTCCWLVQRGLYIIVLLSRLICVLAHSPPYNVVLVVLRLRSFSAPLCPPESKK